MRFRKPLGLTLLYLGVIVILFALLAMFLPRIENEQWQLILASLKAPVHNATLGFINRQFVHMIEYHGQWLIAGCALSLLGILALLLFRKPEKAADGAVLIQSPMPNAKRKGEAKPSPMPSTDPNAPQADWRRPTPRTPSVLDPALDDPALGDPAPYKDFSPLLASQEPPKPSPKASHAMEVNPYYSYGQSAYTPPPKADSPSSASSIEKETRTSPYEKPAALKEKEAAEATEAQEAPVQEPAPSLAFHSPAVSPASPRAVVKDDALPRTFRTASSAHNAPAKLSPAPRLGSDPKCNEPADSLARQKPRYISGRIRSTVRARAPEA